MYRRRALPGILIIASLAMWARPAWAVDLPIATQRNATQERASSDHSRLLELHNSTRSDHGVAPLRVSSYLNSIAQRRSDQMAQAQRIWHDYGIGRHVDGDHIIGENVGRGPTIEDIFAAFMDSSSHRANIIRRVYDQVGIAAVLGEDGNVYVTVVFLSPELSRARNPQQTVASQPEKDPAAHREVAVLLELVRLDSR